MHTSPGALMSTTMIDIVGARHENNKLTLMTTQVQVQWVD